MRKRDKMLVKDLRYFFLGLLFVAGNVWGQNDSIDVAVDSAVTKKNDLSFVNEYDSLFVEHIKGLWGERNVNPERYEGHYDSLETGLVEFRIKELNEVTPFDFRFNSQTKAMLNLYINKRRYLTSKMLGYKELYFPIFEEKLLKYNLPLELKYLPIVESALNPRARSRVGAGGLWQFMPRTGEIYGLTINSYVDKRSDPYLSSEAACKYLDFLHSIYNDWNLVLAAYNAGPGNVNKAIRRSGGKTTYWEIREYLPRETQNYVPAFIAVNYVMNYYEQHGLEPIDVPYSHIELDTVHVCQRIEFDVLDEWLGYDEYKISELNPMFVNRVIPKTNDSYSLVLPFDLVGDFIENEDSIYKYSSLEYKHYVAQNKLKRVQTYHVVKQGETLEDVAKKYNCLPEDIKAWNNRSKIKMYKGRKLIVFKETDSVEEVKKDQERASQHSVMYTVKRGDTLWDIAQKYRGVSVNDIKRANNGMSSRLRLGQKIKIPVK